MGVPLYAQESQSQAKQLKKLFPALRITLSSAEFPAMSITMIRKTLGLKNCLDEWRG